MCCDDQHRSGRLEAYTSLDTDDRIAYVHVTTDTVCRTNLLDLLDRRDLILEHLAIHGIDLTLLKLDAELLAAGLRHLFQVGALRQSLLGIQDLTTADRGTPQPDVVRILHLREIGLKAMLFQIVDLLLTA